VNEVGGACGTQRREEKSVPGLDVKSRRKETAWKMGEWDQKAS
jgi:hypothetical protein